MIFFIDVQGIFNENRVNKTVYSIEGCLLDKEVEVVGHEAVGQEGDLVSVVFELA